MVDIYDPSKIRIQGAKTGTVRKPMQFDSTYINILIKCIAVD